MIWQPDPLSNPVGRLVRPVDPLSLESSLQALADTLREEGLPAVPVVDGGVFVRMAGEQDLVRALGDGSPLQSSLRETLAQINAETEVNILRPYSTGAEALRVFADSGLAVLPVVDDGGVPLGVLLPSSLTPHTARTLRPRLVGGMATPLGVYLTTGAVSGGAKPLALVLTGGLLFGLFVLAAYASLALVTALPEVVTKPIGAGNLYEFLAILLFLVAMRLAPLAGTHGAEHMVVHAIERGEELTPNVVRRMPRVHPRCGTNLAVAAMLFIGISTSEWVPDMQLRVLVAILTTLILFRPLGSFVQQYLTTKPPTDAQLENGIAAGKQLLDRHATGGRTQASTFGRLLNSGLFHVMAGAMVLQLVVWAVLTVLQVPEAWRVI